MAKPPTHTVQELLAKLNWYPDTQEPFSDKQQGKGTPSPAYQKTEKAQVLEFLSEILIGWLTEWQLMMEGCAPIQLQIKLTGCLFYLNLLHNIANAKQPNKRTAK